MIFEAKKDKFFSTIFYGVMSLVLLSCVIVFKSISSSEDWWGFGALIATLFLLIWIWYGTEYKIVNNVLNVVSGPVKKNIAVRSISKIEIGKTMWLGYKLGLSKGGLIIHYNQYDEIYIAPMDNDKFCKALKRIHSEIEIAKNID